MRDAWTRLIAAGPGRRTRLHDERGRRMPLGHLRYVPLNLFWTVRRRLTGRVPELPWVPFDALARLGELLDPSWSALEFGSGSSTAWLAARVGRLHSIESNPAWHDRVAPGLPGNVRYELRTGADYWDLGDHPDASLDFVVVDGIDRDRCVEAALPKVRPGGWVYLDNSDRALRDPSIGRAEQLLEEAARARRGTIEQHTGLPVGALIATGWTLARL